MHNNFYGNEEISSDASFLFPLISRDHLSVPVCGGHTLRHVYARYHVSRNSHGITTVIVLFKSSLNTVKPIKPKSMETLFLLFVFGVFNNIHRNNYYHGSADPLDLS